MKEAWVGIVVSGASGGFSYVHDATKATRGSENEGALWYSPPLPLHEADDQYDAPLFLSHGDDDGLSVYSPDCGGVEEFERRVVRALGLDATIDDSGPAAFQQAPDFWEQPPPARMRILVSRLEFTIEEHVHRWDVKARGLISAYGEVDAYEPDDVAYLERVGLARWVAVGNPGGQDSRFQASDELLVVTARQRPSVIQPTWVEFDSPIGERS